jgi:hypothetical protein
MDHAYKVINRWFRDNCFTHDGSLQYMSFPFAFKMDSIVSRFYCFIQLIYDMYLYNY